MEQGFWKKLHTPFFVLAPMADVTDAAFRQIIAKYSRHGQPGGGPDVFWTEFVAADGLMSPGREVLRHDLRFGENEHPIVAQLFGARPERMEGAARLCLELGFDGIDINMGCPDKSIEKQLCGAAMIKNPEIAVEIIRAAKRGAPGLPISVKTRIGYNKNEIDTWVPKLLEEGIAALTIHCRTRKEMSAVPARWEHVKEVVDIRDRMGVATLIIGNGDVKNLDDAKEKAAATGCDGVMLGRAIFGNPWLFDQNKKEVPTEEKLRVLVEHTKLYEELLGGIKSFAIMKKHYKAYVNGFDGAMEVREKLMLCNNATEVEATVNEFLKTHTVG
jgi:nifR3 family TIM-barrel protein